ncbi:MAG: recombinase family protein [Sciscionella sp.]
MNQDTTINQRAVLYLRVARSAPETSTIERQREGCQHIAAKCGLTIIREYADLGCPARLERQPQLWRLLGELGERRDAASVVVWDYSRLAHDMTRLEDIVARIRRRGATVATMTGVETAIRHLHERGTDNQ